MRIERKLSYGFQRPSGWRSTPPLTRMQAAAAARPARLISHQLEALRWLEALVAQME